MEFIKGNNHSIQKNIKVLNTLPSTANENDLAILSNDGIYQYKNNQWNCIISFIVNAAPPIIGEIKASIGQPDNNWLLCDGSTFSATDYPELYNLLGSNTLPDFREVIPVGVGQNSTNTIPDHDVFTLGQKKDWNLQTHFHCKTENTHTHSLSTTQPAHTHNYSIYCNKCYCYCCYYNFCGAQYRRYCYNTNSTVWSNITVGSSSGKWSTSPTVGNPSSGTAILRVNSYGVNFYIRAK